MNWLGYEIQALIEETDTVLDLGCGIMAATSGSYNGTDSIRCKFLLGTDINRKYLKVASKFFPCMKLDLKRTLAFEDNTFDVVMALDVVEHLPYPRALWLIKQMKRIAKKKVIIFTPKEFTDNEENVADAWGLGRNELNRHLCCIPPLELADLGFHVIVAKVDGNSIGVWLKQ